MKIATQSEIDQFYKDTENNPSIYPYRGISKFKPRWEASTDNSKGLIFTNDNNTFLLNIAFHHYRVLEFEVSLFSKNTYAAGKGLQALLKMVTLYKPRAVNTSVQASNVKSLAINRKMWGKEWGIEPNIAWNPLIGEYEDLYYFRKVYI